MQPLLHRGVASSPSSRSHQAVSSPQGAFLQTPCIRQPALHLAKQLRDVATPALFSRDYSSSPSSRKHLTPPPVSAASPSATPSTSSPSTSTPRLPFLSPPPPARPPLADPLVAQQLNHLLKNTIAPNGSTTLAPANPPQPSAASASARSPRTPTGPYAGNSTCWWFAYGTSLHQDSLLSHDVHVLSRDAAVVRDANVHMVFRHKGGQATLMKLSDQEQSLYTPPGACVHGVLYKVDEAALGKLQQLDRGYELAEVEVQTYAGHAVRSWVFVSSRMALLPREVPPTESYMRQLREGAADQFLDPAYQAWLSSIETVSSAGLPMDYFNTPSKYALHLAAALGIAAAAAAFLSHL